MDPLDRFSAAAISSGSSQRAFVAILLEFPDACHVETVDLNGDGQVDGLDVQLFVDLLT